MFNYAQLNEENICIGISQLSGEVNVPNMILLDSYDISLLGKKYNNDQWEDIEHPEQLLEPTETERIMQAMTDAELRDMVTQQNQELLAQQITDIEVALLGGGR
ncbi:hypothetical protein [Anaerotignum propionicum]|uniref:hypothetical protein n=1 Tax=Anaerotignum propionicum TaxID=28446 RepID=UPI00210F01ED|nr:hypothetical protein [Anaerotignum propionicum]MCQ4935044.1 hypothetical protein [Anaerotignum propionicum]